MRKHCSAKYSATSSDHSDLLRELNSAVMREGEVDPRVDWRWEDTLAARAALRPGKSTGHSAVSAEVLQVLPFEFTWGLHQTLRKVYYSDELSPAGWRWIKLMLLPKQTVPQNWDQYRGICLLNVMSKICVGDAMEIARRWSREVLGERWEAPMLSGFERGFQCEDVLGVLQGLVDEAFEWGGSVHSSPSTPTSNRRSTSCGQLR